MLAPVVLFVYNRPEHLERTVKALTSNYLASESELFVFSDGPRSDRPGDREKVEAVRKIIKSLKGFKRVELIERAQNQGLAPSVIQGIDWMFRQYPSVIVLEDDMISSQDFLNFMNDALDFYQSFGRVFSISGYSYPLQIPAHYPHDVYFLPRASSWGWATWRERWTKADWEVKDFKRFVKNTELIHAFNQGGADLTPMLIKQQQSKISSWAVRWCYTHFKEAGLGVFPVRSKIQNIGADGSGVHMPNSKKYDTKLATAPYRFTTEVALDDSVLRSCQEFFKPSLYRRLKNWWLTKTA